MTQAASELPDAFRKLRARPLYAWPTIVLMVLCLAVVFASWTLVLMALMPVALGCVLNCVAMYYLFSPIHDAIHRSMAHSNKLNDFFMWLILLPIVPFSNGRLLRVMHMQHHRFANDPERDPDHWTMTAPFKMFWIWFAWDFYYLYFYLRHKDQFKDIDVGKPVRDTIWVWTLAFSIGYFHPEAVIFLWFVPSRLMAWLIAAVFMYLPHWPHDIEHEKAPYQATHNRLGLEWLLTPVLSYQNYHLVHHLYPTVPFYRYRKIWQAREAWHNSHSPSFVAPFSRTPNRLKAGADSSLESPERDGI